MADPVIALERVTLRYPTAPSPTLRDISFRVEPGEFVGIVGSTGSGKSTLLYLLAGVIPHYFEAELSGDVLIHGRRTQELSLARISERVGLVLQDPEAQLFNLLVRDELAWGLENRGLPREEIASRLSSTLSFFRIEKLQNRITYDLSGGEKQRVALAAVHAIAPEVYLFDHPTSQLDPIGAAEVIAAVRRLAGRHQLAIVMVEDKVDELVEHADRLVLLDGGRIVLDAGPREFCLRKDLLDAAGVRPTQMAELSHRLIEAGVKLDVPPITLEEMTVALRARLHS
jgi:energy-coupling factor transport system ATP-binding protein